MSNSTDGGPQYPASPNYDTNPWAQPTPQPGQGHNESVSSTSSAQSTQSTPANPSVPVQDSAGPFTSAAPSWSDRQVPQSGYSHYPQQEPQRRASTSRRSASRTRVWPAVVTASFASAALATAGTFAVMNSTPSVASAAAETPAVQQVSQLVTTELESVVADVADTVVAIDVRSQSGESLGSGVIIDASGYILTNNHVVSGATALQVTLADGRIYSASIVGTDATTDLAVVKLDNAPSDLTVATTGDSSAVRVGQDVVAVGNPLGLSSTVTTGIVSAIDRPVSTVDQTAGDRVVTNAIQVDAAINPGNSGGPLFNASGEVIGITSSIAALASDSGSIGLGFAIPSNLAQRVATEIIETGTASHALLGVSLGDTAVQVDGVTRAGAQVGQVVAGSGAANAGLRAGDVIVSIDGNTVTGAESLTGFVREYTPGSQVVLGVVRNGTLEEITATLGTSD